MKASELFTEKPQKWGWRGDPNFWNHLQSIFAEFDCPMRPEDIERIVKTEYKLKTGEELTPSSEAYVKEYDTGGMSRGRLNGNFWCNVAIPMIQERNNNTKN